MIHKVVFVMCGLLVLVSATLREHVHAVAARLGNWLPKPNHLNFNPYYYENT